jgi:DNA topoisomerase-1
MVKKVLILVESPSKTKKIEGFLNKGQKEIQYIVKASVGHIRDLTKHNNLGVDVDDNFKTYYDITEDKKQVVNGLRRIYANCSDVLIATDPDREGERIAYDLAKVLKLKDPKRIVFSEITKTAITNAIKKPIKIDQNIVDAQTCRRVLDRLIGFKISPVVQQFTNKKTSAGRVQSVVVRLICEKEKTIEEFKSASDFEVHGDFINEDEINISGTLNKTFNYESATKFMNDLVDKTYSVGNKKITNHSRNPPPPYITSTIQQDASKRLRFSVKHTTQLLQKLYQGGYITYIRTDSTNISEEAIQSIGEEVINRYGEDYHEPRNYVKKVKGAQQAHECIRPTNIKIRVIGDAVSEDENRLYLIIWKRTMASQMKAMELERVLVKVDISEMEEFFNCQNEVITFDGFDKVYKPNFEKVENEYKKVVDGEELDYTTIKAQEKFKKPPPRYSEASLVKELEKRGIGRPSTYQSSVSKIQDKGYVVKKNLQNGSEDVRVITLKNNAISEKTNKRKIQEEKGKLIPTELGIEINDFLTDKFENIVNYDFTCNIEELLDNISTGGVKWKAVAREVYDSFIGQVEMLMKEMPKRVKKGSRLLGEDVYVADGRFGPYLQENGKCYSIPEDVDSETITLEEARELMKYPRVVCQKDGKDVVLCFGKFGFYLKYAGKTFSLKGKEVEELEEKDFIEIVGEKKSSVLKTLKYKKKEIKVMNGKYGEYFHYDGKNYKIPAKIDAKKITLKECKGIIG